MTKRRIIRELREWRLSRGLTMEEAGAMIVVDGKEGVGKAVWHTWETGFKIPRAAYMIEIERVTGVQPNAYYDRPTTRVHVPENDRRQLALIA